MSESEYCCELTNIYVQRTGNNQEANEHKTEFDHLIFFKFAGNNQEPNERGFEFDHLIFF
jgi:hypothetical protein